MAAVRGQIEGAKPRGLIGDWLRRA